MSATSLEILSRARELIAERKHWLQKNWAADQFGSPCLVESSAAVCFCSIGALKKAVLEKGLPTSYAIVAQIKLSETLGGQTVIRFNDSHTHVEVLAKFDEAIQNAQLPGP